MDSMYEIIMDLPLFQGVSREKISELVEKTKFHFLKYSDKDQIVAIGDPCKHVRFIISGSIRIETPSTNKRVTISEVLTSPNVVGADYLFGRDTIYPFNAYANGNCGVLQIEKGDYINILHNDKVFLFNLLNTLSRNSQKVIQGILSLSTGTLTERIALFVIALTQKGGTDIHITYKQKDFCTLLGVQRSSFISTLAKLQDDGIINYTQSEIQITSRERMLDILHSTDD
ncbi:MAG: Crp/Fnr family transcriptional regulator [Muribaculaceae bacterium]